LGLSSPQSFQQFSILFQYYLQLIEHFYIKSQGRFFRQFFKSQLSWEFRSLFKQFSQQKQEPLLSFQLSFQQERSFNERFLFIEFMFVYDLLFFKLLMVL
jgi:hypothetical protein